MHRSEGRQTAHRVGPPLKKKPMRWTDEWPGGKCREVTPLITEINKKNENLSFFVMIVCFFFSSRRRHTRLSCDWSSDVCSSDPHAQRERTISSRKNGLPSAL